MWLFPLRWIKIEYISLLCTCQGSVVSHGYCVGNFLSTVNSHSQGMFYGILRQQGLEILHITCHCSLRQVDSSSMSPSLQGGWSKSWPYGVELSAGPQPRCSEQCPAHMCQCQRLSYLMEKSTAEERGEHSLGVRRLGVPAGFWYSQSQAWVPTYASKLCRFEPVHLLWAVRSLIEQNVCLIESHIYRKKDKRQNPFRN